MKKILATVMMMIMLIAMASGLAYADESITQKDINEGLTFCAEYPVQLALDGKQINFEQKDVPPVIIKERTLIPARALFEAMGGVVTWKNEDQSVHVKYDNTEVVLTIGSKQAMVNGQAKQLEVPALIIDHDGDYYGSTMIPVRFTAEALGSGVSWEDSTRSVLIKSPTAPPGFIPIVDSETGSNTNANSSNNPILNPNADPNKDTNTGNDSNKDTTNNNPNSNNSSNNSSNNNSNLDIGTNSNTTWQYEQLNEAAKGKIVVIDAGHGGKDCGAIGHEKLNDQLSEKELTLPSAIKLNEYLRSAGVTTYLLRDTDIYYTLLERSYMANDAGATMFVSMHINSNESSVPNGSEVLYNSKIDAEGKSEVDLYGIQSKNIAKNVQSEMVQALGTTDRGVKNSPGMAVLNKTSMPAIIVEGAFLSNERDFDMMQKSDFADNYALAVAKGIIKSLNEAFK